VWSGESARVLIMSLFASPFKVITILCGPQSNLGAVRSTTVPLLKDVLEPLLRELVNSLQPDSSENSFPVATYYQ
jgi:hypothetical protein